MIEIYHMIINTILGAVSAWGYFGIFFLMFLESTLFPFPSEVVMIPAGFMAFNGEMNMYFAIAAGTAGSVLGALFNYYFARYAGRVVLLKFIKEEKLDYATDFFKKNGALSTFVGRLLPVIRQYISLPAGIAKVNVVTFATFTALGAFLWVTFLTLIGYYLGGQEELIKKYLSQFTCIAISLFILWIVFYLYKKKK
jgi:membrane protein DedA with SNARE-associated domain